MHTYLLFIEFIILGISLAAPIGPVKLEMIRQGTTSGFKRAFLTGAGAMTVDLFYMTLIFWGISSFMDVSLLMNFITIAGSALLFYTGLTSVFSTMDEWNQHTFPASKKFTISPYLTGMSLAAANPFILVFWLSVYTSALQKLPDAWENHIQYLFSLTIFFGIFLWNLNLSLALHFFRKFIHVHMLKFISILSGCLLIIYSIVFISSLWRD
ncbi:LysE family translocator [Fictibacillus iocasae]|uniref:LysE family translocator n=1 Tax=Fictibacillus iocasae TaxID=2715437 RepID=A0ABW2NUV3_9BACL